MNRKKLKYYIISSLTLLGGMAFVGYSVSYDPELGLILDLIGKIFFPRATGGEWGLVAIPIIWGVAIGLLISGVVFFIKAIRIKAGVEPLRPEIQLPPTAQPSVAVRRIRWKGGIVALIFLITFGFATLDPFGGGDFGIVFIILGSILLTAIFLFTIYRSEKRILDSRYSFWWLARLNAIFILSLYAIGYLGLLAFINFYFGGPGEQAGYAAAIIIVVGVIWIPITVLSVSVIPSLYFYKFYGSKRIFRATSLLFVALSFVLALYSTISSSTCNFNKNYICIAEKAIAAYDDSLCEQTKDVHQDFDERTYCYLELSRSGQWSDIGLCNKLSPPGRKRTRCLINVGITTNNSSVCEKVPSDSPTSEKEFCYNAIKYRTIQ